MLDARLAERDLAPGERRSEVILKGIEQQQKADRLTRQKRVNAALKDMGVVTDDARHQFISDATNGATQSSGSLTQAQFELVMEAIF
jgi:hypothetical protein